jgi:methionine-rich copper-binding protein CopC
MVAQQSRLVRVLVITALIASTMFVLGVFNAPNANAAPCDFPVTNKVACENTQTGADDWQAQYRDDTILGYTTDISYNVGQTVSFKMLTSASSYKLDIYRLGWYSGKGARYMGTVQRNTPQNQPPCLRDAPTALIDCGNWAVSVTWNIPSTAVSGIYYARMTRLDTGAENEMAFVVRDDASTSKVFFQTSDATWVAYNRYGGNSLYFGDGPGQGGSSYKVSYNRPYTGGDGDENFIFNAEYPMLRFLERNGYDMSYTTDVDSARRGNLIKNHKVFMAVGHDEYWSNEQMANVMAARDAGVHMAFLTGNEIFWKTRWEKSLDSSQTDWRTIACFKETKGTQNDGLSNWTGTWRDPRFSPPQDGGRPENALLGNMFTVNGRRDDSLQVPAAYGKMRLWRNTDLVNLASGTSYTFQPGTLGYEWNTVYDNGYQPAGVAQMSRTTVNLDGYYALKNYGDEYGGGPETHAITYYRAPSGALVFGAGTVQWAWGVDDEHAFLTNTPTSDKRIKQATVNFLADMGVQPYQLWAADQLVISGAINDNAAPGVQITTLPSQSTVGQPYTFGGTVIDASGKVAGVEVSTDGGTRWHYATWQAGLTTWSYTYTPSQSGTAALRVRAVDDSLNLSTPVQASPNVGARTCPCGMFSGQEVPKVTSADDSSQLELGVKWKAASNGYVRGVKFYKGTGNTGSHTGSLWAANGDLLATGTFTNESPTGWQTLLFPSPIAVNANTTYVVSYFTPTGHFAYDTGGFFDQQAYMEPVTGLKSGVDGANGVFRFGAGFPNNTFDDTNYWVDVVWATDPGPDTRSPIQNAMSPVSNAGSVALDTTVSGTFDENVTLSSAQVTVTGPAGAVSGTKSISNDARTITFTPSTPLAAATAYTVTMKAADAANNMSTQSNWTFTTGSPRPAACPCTIWDDFAAPAVVDAGDATQVELGTKVRFDGKGEVLGVRFYKGTGNTGTHTGSLWTSTGLLLATGTFSGETTSGWQKLMFSSPVQVQANTTYVVSYYAPVGRYSVSSGYFNGQGATYQSLHALQNGDDGGNGVYRYGAGGGFPTSSYNATNYWVDVIYRNGLNGDTTPPSVTNRSPGVDATNVGLQTALTTTFSEPVDPASAQIWLTDPKGAKLNGSVSLSGDQKTVTWTPSGKLVAGTRYQAHVGIADVNGIAMPTPAEWGFTTTTTPICPCSLFSTATVPAVTASDDGGAYELGLRFSPSQSGQITGVRFYKGSGNSGTHTGSLWNASGQRLATGTFSGETASGWQTLTFSSPVVVSSGQTYTASYTTTTGHYAVNAGYFSTGPVTSAPLTAPQEQNGVFQPGSGFPTMTYGSGNYWVDVVYQPNADNVAPVMQGHTPLAGASQVDLTSTITASFDEPVDVGTAQFNVTDPGGAKIAGTLALSPDGRMVTFTPAARFAASTVYSVSVKIADTFGNMMANAQTWSFTSATTQTCPCSLFSGATVPTVTSADDNGAYELGVKFTSTANGQITGVKFYKGAGNTGSHTGSLWTADGQRLATGTFSGETESGWQTLTFSSPVSITAGTTYVASYTTTTGHYAVNAGYFGSVTSPPLGATASAGVFTAGSGFPTSTYNGGNYWVDVVFQ